MSVSNQIITIIIIVIATMITRFLPFLVFKNKEMPDYILYLGDALPPALFGMLVIYSLKDINFLSSNHAIPEMIAIIVIVIIHIWKRNMIVSMVLGTATYIFLNSFL
ncbi:branched-chain amino acid transporter permease [Mammaliicoccus vitulinus]|uniref:branched-chain amino acid transporter permease n=1 Tax=Mammaliicoccus vitulinus TaxID=71237 RepID=UPI000D1F724D|nr:AzlD domain-containing protein [Mammaliicoccus vitulinus]PTI69420.1 branched-chain amino acid transporter AzlD [Mammaliicoccus vitulinus]